MKYSLPVIVEKDEDGMYIVECPVLSGCYSQGKTIDEALLNIHEVIDLVKDEPASREVLENYAPQEVSLHTVTI